MDRLSQKLRNLIISVSEQFLAASVQVFQAIVFALLTIPESISSATSLGDLAWDQLLSPGPHAPAGDLSFRLIRIWTNHVVEVELPQFRNLAVRFDWQSALNLSSLEWPPGLATRLLVYRALICFEESKTQLLGNVRIASRPALEHTTAATFASDGSSQ